eukprot:9441092-Pyramimonas_sp.AAC.1
MDIDRPQLSNGRPTGFTSPWVRQIQSDIVEAAAILDSCALDELADDLEILGDAEEASEFVALDFSELRARVYFINVPPPGGGGNGQGDGNKMDMFLNVLEHVKISTHNNEEAEVMGEELRLACGMSLGTGHACEATFYARRDLMNHLRRVRGHRSLCHQTTPSNICINCKQRCGSRSDAARHLQGSLARGSCETRGPSTLKSTAAAPAPPACPLCPREGPNLLQLRDHLR